MVKLIHIQTFKGFLLFLYLCGATHFVHTQVVDINWQKCLGGAAAEYGEAICNGFISDFYIASAARSVDGDVFESFGNSDIWITRLDLDGSLLWQKSVGGSDEDYPESIIATLDSSIVVCGHSYSDDGLVDTNYESEDIVVFKMDTLGNIQWLSVLPGSDDESAYSIIEITGGGYLLTGYCHSDDGLFTDHIGSTEYGDMVVVKLNSLGVVEWSKSFGSDRDDAGRQIIETSDGNFIIAGNKWGGLAMQSQYCITKISLTGDIIWEVTYGGSDYDCAYAVVEISPGRYLVSGESYSSDGDVYGAHGSRDAWTLLLNNTGGIIWSRAYGGTGADFNRSLIKYSDNSYIISGATTSPNNGDVVGFHGVSGYSDMWVLAIDSLSVIQWQKCLGGTKSENGNGAVLALDGIVIIGDVRSEDGDVIGFHEGEPFSSDSWVLKLYENCAPIMYYADTDFDGYGNPDVYVYSCTDTLGYVIDNTDCIDTNALIHPELPEQCNTIDDNCDGVVDEGFVYVLQYADADGDSYGNQDADSLGCPGLAGYVSDSLDCNDNNPDIYPEAIELLNGIDDDCDGLNDEGLVVDGYGAGVLQVYPVPAADYIRIETEMPTGGTLQVFNPSGEQVFEIKNWSGEILAIDSLPW